MTNTQAGLARTPDEIRARVAALSNEDFFGFETGDLIEWLPFEAAREFLKPEVTATDWTRKTGDPLDEVRDYLPFAWDKANNCRGISASRSVSHMKAWLWMAGYDLSETFDQQYTRYGKPCLVTASIIAGFDWGAEDDGDWVNDESGEPLDMAKRQQMIDAAQAIADAAMAEKRAPA